jgi:hypothetical protein
MNMMTPIEERDKALSVIDPFLLEISMVFRECYLSEGKGALLVYADAVINGNIPTEGDYTTKNDVLEIIDGIEAKAGLAALLSKYDPHTEGILVLIPSIDAAPFFIIIKLKSRSTAD